jgi:hypothetical protein
VGSQYLTYFRPWRQAAKLSIINIHIGINLAGVAAILRNVSGVILVDGMEAKTVIIKPLAGGFQVDTLAARPNDKVMAGIVKLFKHLGGARLWLANHRVLCGT